MVYFSDDCGHYEFGITADNGHTYSHALFVSKEKMKFNDIKKVWKEFTGTKPNEIHSASNVEDCIKYCSKEDVKACILNIDMDKLSLPPKRTEQQ